MESEETNSPQMKAGRKVPIDRGWAWFVLLGAYLEMVLLGGLFKSGGIIFVAFQDRFKSSSAGTSLISTVQNVVASVFDLIIMTAGVKLTSCRNLVFIGSFFMCGSFILNAFFMDIRLIVVSHGVVQGIGFALVQAPTISMVGQYFDKRRGLATGLAASGTSLGSLIFAPLLTFLLENYAYRGCMLILAALYLELWVTAALFRPLSFYLINQKTGFSKNAIQKLTSAHSSEDHKDNIEMKSDDFTADDMDETTQFEEHRLMTAHSNCKTDIGPEDQETKRTLRYLWKTFVHYLDLQLLLDPVFVLLQLSFGLMYSGNVIGVIFVAPHAKDIGLDIQQIATLITIFSAIELCSRNVIGILADMHWCRPSYIVCICSILIGISSNCVTFYSNFSLIVVHVVLLGTMSGSMFSLLAVVIVDFMSLKKLDATLGFTFLIIGVSIGVTFYIAGFLRDVTGNYIATFHLFGALSFSGAAIIFVLPYIEKWKSSKQRDVSTKEKE